MNKDEFEIKKQRIVVIFDLIRMITPDLNEVLKETEIDQKMVKELTMFASHRTEAFDQLRERALVHAAATALRDLLPAQMKVAEELAEKVRSAIAAARG